MLLKCDLKLLVLVLHDSKLDILGFSTVVQTKQELEIIMGILFTIFCQLKGQTVFGRSINNEN